MAHHGFLGGAFPHELPWQLAHVSMPVDALHQLQVQAPPCPLVSSSSGWDHNDAVPSNKAVLMDQLVAASGFGAPSPSSLYASCYSSPHGSPPAKPDFAERAGRLPFFAGSGGGNNSNNNDLSRVASSQSLLPEPAASPRGGVKASDGSSSDGPTRKRKLAPSGATGGKSSSKAKSPDASERQSKKTKLLSVDSGDDDEETKNSDGKGKEVVVAEPPKDYIHVRARRGQATDSHSLAERVRREKISERMKLLQDIVPGCGKVTGKAVMLDEIINYVQSLQRQVEFLSMKLSTVNPRHDVDVDSFVEKDVNQSCTPTSLPPPVYSVEGSNSPFCYASSPAPAVQSAVARTKSIERTSSFVSHGVVPDHSIEAFQIANPQIESLWEDDLQSLVQMGFRGNTNT